VRRSRLGFQSLQLRRIPQSELSNSAAAFVLHSGKITQVREDFTMDDGRVFNPDSESGQSREGAKKLFALGVSANFAPLRGQKILFNRELRKPRESFPGKPRDVSRLSRLSRFPPSSLFDCIGRSRAFPRRFLPQRTQREELMTFLLCGLCVLCGSIPFGCGGPRWAFCASETCAPQR